MTGEELRSVIAVTSDVHESGPMNEGESPGEYHRALAPKIAVAIVEALGITRKKQRRIAKMLERRGLTVNDGQVTIPVEVLRYLRAIPDTLLDAAEVEP